jgi:hypothetical protein
MAAINANIVVDQTNLSIATTTNSIGVTVEPINLGVYTTSPTPVGGTNGQLQYNNNSSLGGIANTSVANGNITFTNLANVKIAGGTNAYYLQTDGANNLTWAAGGTPTGSGVPSGANTLIQLSDGSGAFASGAGFSFDNASNIFSAPGRALVAGNVETSGLFVGDGGGLSNIAGGTKIVHGTSNVDIINPNGNVTVTVNGIADVIDVGDANTTFNSKVILSNDLSVTTGIITGDGGGISNIQPGNIVGLSLSQIANGTSNVNIPAVDGNINISSAGNTNIAIVTGTGVNVAGTLNATGVITGDGGGISNIASANIVGLAVSEISNGTSNINIATANGNITANVNGIDVMQISDTTLTLISDNTGGITGIQAPNTFATFSGLNVDVINYPVNGQTFKTVLGKNSTASNTGGTAYGYNSSASGDRSVAIGNTASTSGANAVSIGWIATAKDDSVSVGAGAGGGSYIGLRVTSVGAWAGVSSSTNIQAFTHGTAVGYRAGHAYQGDRTVAVGAFAGSENFDSQNELGQNEGAIAVGYRAGYDGQNEYATAIGFEAGDTNQGNYSVAVGFRAGDTDQANNSIVLNATASALTTATANTFNVKPVRNAGASGLPAGFEQVAYNPTTGEFVYYS